MLKLLIYHIKRPYHFLKTGLLNGVPAQIKYGFPARKLNITTITGTDGKTTSATMLYQVLKSAGYKVGLISTVAAYIGDEEIDTGFHVTSPQPSQVQKFMRRMVDAGFTHLILEATSHGSYQFRTWGISSNTSGVTNIAHEHLDYHINYNEYLKAKANILKQARTVVLNEDDQSFNKLRKILKRKTQKLYGIERTVPAKVRQAITKTHPEAYNQQNARLVYTLAKEIGVSDADIAKGISEYPGVPGRMETLDIKTPYTVIVDFAHTPQGLEAALAAVRKQLIEKNTGKKTKGRLIAVGGCAGLRDFAKRPVMGKIAADLADMAVFTAEDPRTENVWSIIRQMKEQLEENHNHVLSIADRREAIAFAMNNLAKRGDIVLLFGKGPEKSMCYGTTEYPWSDKQTALDIAQGK